jgi:tRNA-uridine 2-sulfurtransferase
MNKKAVALFSGGLDSLLAVKLMIDQGVEVVAVNFTSPFFSCTPKSGGDSDWIRLITGQVGAEILMIPKGMDFLAMVKNPPHGYGKNMNPCIDCRIYMLRKVKDLMVSLGASFVITGEVLGQRPMSQHTKAIRTIDKESGLEGLILRPLSAGLLPPSIPEQEGIVDREKLLSLSGRTRRPQMDLADKLGIKDYPSPAGGCLLTEKIMASRLRDLFTNMPDFDMTDINLLKIGRHFRLGPKLKVVLGRDEAENNRLMDLSKKGSMYIQPANFRGPSALSSAIPDESQEQLIGQMITHYTKDELDQYVLDKLIQGEDASALRVTGKLSLEILDTFQISPDEQETIRSMSKATDLHEQEIERV